MSEPITNVEDAVAKLGALPVPVGPVPQRSELETLRARVAELEAERHTANESLDDAAKALRADRDRIAELERVIADAPASYVLMDRARAAAQELRGRDLLDAVTVERAEQAHWRRLGLEDPHDSPLHHPYTTPHDLPESGGALTPGACKACGSAPDRWCPDCGACQRGCYDGFVDNLCTHANASWVGVE